MEKSQKHIFLYALIITFVIFNLGIFMGYMLELSREGKINVLYTNSEMSLFDQIAQKDAMNILNLDCSSLVEENIRFGDRIFEDAKLIQDYEEANRITSEIKIQHRRFDLLRTIFWINSIEIKQKCKSNYHNIVYLYKYNNPSIEQESKQKFFSNLLSQLKEKTGNDIMLIPIAGDNNITSVDLMIKKYNIKELPVILIDEKIIVTEAKSVDEMKKLLG
jgi:hypothetical protein